MGEAQTSSFLFFSASGLPFHGVPFLSNSAVFEHCDRFLESDYHVVVRMQGDGNGEGGPPGPPFVALTDEEVEQCLLVMNDTQHRAAFRLMVDLGIGPGELFGDDDIDRGLYIQDIDSRKMVLKVHYRSARNERFSIREVPLTAYCMTALRDFLFSGGRTLHDTGRLFDITDRRWRQVLLELPERAKVTKSITNIILRRTAIIKMLRAGVDPNEVRRRMGILRMREEMFVYAVGFVLNDPDVYDQLIKQAVYETLVVGGRPAPFPSGFSGPGR